MIIDKSLLKNYKFVAEGYKIFNYDWSSNFGNYCYADENGNVEGLVHRQEGFPKKCNKGLHFCTNPLDCLKFYPLIQWNKFAKVRGYGEFVSNNKDSKIAAEVLEIIKILSFEEFIEEIKKYDSSINTEGIFNSYATYYSSSICNSDGIFNSKSVDKSSGLSLCRGIKASKGLYGSYRINYSSGISAGSEIGNSRGIFNSYGVKDCDGVSSSYGIEFCDGINDCFFIKCCDGLTRSIMCYKVSGKYKLFNKDIAKQRYWEIANNITHFLAIWYPCFTNTLNYYNEEKGWEEVPASKIKKVDNKIVYKDMPKDLIEYLKKLPEFDAKIFTEITGIEIN